MLTIETKPIAARRGRPRGPSAKRQFEKLESLILRDEQVGELVGLSRATRWRLEGLGMFPARVRLGPRAVGWRRKDVLEWLDSRQTVSSVRIA